MPDSSNNKPTAATPAAPALRFGELEARKLSTLLADSITETILKEGLQPGARLPSERDMREQFGVGRGTLREALRVLEAEGLVTVRSGPHGGPVVAKPDATRLSRMLMLLLIAWDATLRDVYEVRLWLEPRAAEQAASAATPEQIAELSDSVTVLEAILDDEDALIVENQRFHRVLAECSGNPVIVAFALALLTIFDGYAMGAHYDMEARHQIAKVHRAIRDAIVKHDAKRAHKVTLAHIQGSIDFIAERYPEVLDEPLRPTLITRGSETPARRAV